jgi:hypothetical protein
MGVFVWESWITVKIWHQTEWNSFQTKHEIPRRVASNTMRLSTMYPVCSFQSSVPVKLSFNTVFAAISLGNSYECEALATTENIRRVWNIRCIIFSYTYPLSCISIPILDGCICLGVPDSGSETGKSKHIYVFFWKRAGRQRPSWELQTGCPEVDWTLGLREH